MYIWILTAFSDSPQNFFNQFPITYAPFYVSLAKIISNRLTPKTFVIA